MRLHFRHCRLGLTAFVTHAIVAFSGLATCKVAEADVPPLSINPAITVRTAVPQSVFGFNIEWTGFDSGYMRNGRVRPELIKYLVPFRGAIYRYPGGTNSSYFDWRKAIGPVDTRSPQTSQWDQRLVVQFGIEEYRHFLQEVQGVPLMVANAWGEKSRRHTSQQLTESTSDLLTYLNGATRTPAGHELEPCSLGTPCIVRLWELGNEMDWAKQSLSPAEYGSLAKQLAASMRAIDPNLHFVFGGKTASWSGSADASKQFDEQVGKASREFNGNLAYHLYYDGKSIPGVLKYLNSGVTSFAAGRGNENFGVYITEHSRWPTRPRFGNWQDNWHEATDLSAAISAADFWLSTVPDPRIKGLVWHSLSAEGPWQLFSVDPKSDTLIPSAPYWAFRVLRAGFLDNILAAQVIKASASYSGGYDVRLVAMGSSDARTISVLAVNRSPQPQDISVAIAPWKSRTLVTKQYQISGNSPSMSADPRQHPFVAMLERQSRVSLDAQGTMRHTLPGYSVSALIIQASE